MLHVFKVKKIQFFPKDSKAAILQATIFFISEAIFAENTILQIHTSRDDKRWNSFLECTCLNEADF